MGEAASEKVPDSEKGPDRTTASGRAHGKNGCPAGRAEGGAPRGQWGGGGHTHSGAQALFPSLAETRTPPPALPESCVVYCRGCTWFTAEFSALLRSLVPTGPTSLGAVEAHPGFSWATSLPGCAGGTPELGAPGRKPPSFIVYHQQTRRPQKKGWAEATASCPLGRRVTWPLGAGDHTAVQTGGSRVVLGSRRRWGLRAASWARLSERGQLSGPGVGAGAAKWGPGVPSDVEAAGSLHGGGPSCGARERGSAGGLRALGSHSRLACPQQGTRRAWRPRPAEGCPPLAPAHARAELSASAGPLSRHHWVQLELGTPGRGAHAAGPGAPREAPPGCCELPLCSGHPGAPVPWGATPRRPQAASGANPGAPGASDRPWGTQRGDCLLRS